MPKVYIAGPMRGYPNLNFDAFDTAAALGRELGWTVLSPAEKERENGTDPLTYVDTPDGLRLQVEQDIGILLSFRAEDGDAIAMLPGWVKSTGGKAELAVAHWLKLRVLNAENFLPLQTGVDGWELRPRLSCETGQCGWNHAAELHGTRQLAEALANGKI